MPGFGNQDRAFLRHFLLFFVVPQAVQVMILTVKRQQMPVAETRILFFYRKQ